jgi:hypothetical protein
MDRRIGVLAITAAMALPALAQQARQQGIYSRVVYLQEKPGAPGALMDLQRSTADKGAAGLLAAGRSTGYVRMVRVFPSSREAGHDVLYFYTANTPPDFGAPPSDAFYKAAGLTREEWTAKSRSTSDVVKQEIWQSVFSHGSIGKGDTVRLRQYDAPPGGLSAVRSYWRDWQSGMYAKLVDGGIAKAMHFHELLLTPESAPYNFVSLEVYAKGDGPFQAWPNRQESFRSVHAAKDYHSYREESDKHGHSTGTVIYRVETAIWK